MTRDELIKVVRGNTHHSNHFEPIMAAVDAYSKALLQQTPCSMLRELLVQKIKEVDAAATSEENGYKKMLLTGKYAGLQDALKMID